MQKIPALSQDHAGQEGKKQKAFDEHLKFQKPQCTSEKFQVFLIERLFIDYLEFENEKKQPHFNVSENIYFERKTRGLF